MEDTCSQNIALKWHAEASSAVYATPLITALFSDGRKDIVVPAFLHNLEVGWVLCSMGSFLHPPPRTSLSLLCLLLPLASRQRW